MLASALYAFFAFIAVANLFAKDLSAQPLSEMRVAAGCAAWSHVRAIRETGSYVGGGLTGAFDSVVDVRVGRSMVAIHDGPFARASGYDGKTGWSRDHSGASHPLDDAHARGIVRTDAWLDRRGWCDASDGTRYRANGERRIGSRSFDAIGATPKNGAPVTLWIARNSHLIERTEEQLNEERIIASYADWRTVGDLVIPFTRVNSFPEDDDVETFRVRYVRPIAMPGDVTFATIPAPNDVHILGGHREARVPYVVEAQKPIVNVMLDGAGPFPFVLDTGGHFILTSDTARRLGIVGYGRGGRYTRVRELRVGNAVVANLVGEIIPYRFRRLERGPRPPKAGWLGLEFFERFATTFDPVSRRITLAPLSRARPTARGIGLPLAFDDDAPFVTCRIDGLAGPCMLDTGNAGPTIVEGHWAARNRLTRHLQRGMDVGDDDRVSRADVMLGSIDAPHELVVWSPPAASGSEASTAEAAILSEGLLDRFVMTVDYGRHALWMQPVPSAQPRAFNRSGIEADKERDGSFVVWHVIAHSSAADAGMRVDDRILAVDGVPAAKLSGADFVDHMIGAIGEKRTFRIARSHAHAEHSVTILLRESLR